MILRESACRLVVSTLFLRGNALCHLVISVYRLVTVKENVHDLVGDKTCTDLQVSYICRLTNLCNLEGANDHKCLLACYTYLSTQNCI